MQEEEEIITSKNKGLRRADIRSFMKSRENPVLGSGLIDLTSDSLEAVNAVNEENVDGGTSDRVWAADSNSLGHITATDVDGGRVTDTAQMLVRGQVTRYWLQIVAVWALSLPSMLMGGRVMGC